MNWQDLMPGGLALTAGVPVLRRYAQIEEDARSTTSCIVIYADERDAVRIYQQVSSTTELSSRQNLYIDLDTTLGFFWAMRILQDLYEADDHPRQDGWVDHTFCVAAPNPTDEDRVALANCLAALARKTK